MEDMHIHLKEGIFDQNIFDSYIKKWTPETKWEDGKDPKEYVSTGSIFAYKPEE